MKSETGCGTKTKHNLAMFVNIHVGTSVHKAGLFWFLLLEDHTLC